MASNLVKIANHAPFPKLRAAYLRTIAKVWLEASSDGSLTKQLMNASASTLGTIYNRYIPSGSPNNSLSQVTSSVGFDATVSTSNALPVLAGVLSGASTGTDDPRTILDFPYPVRLLFDIENGTLTNGKNNPVWTPYLPTIQTLWSQNGSWGWNPNNGDDIKVYLPAPPKSEDNYPEALAIYAYYFPSILGMPPSSIPLNSPFQITPINPFLLLPSTIQMFIPPSVQAPAVFGEVQLFIIEALARAWTDSTFHDSLYNKTYIDVRPWFEKEMNCEIPWVFQVTFTEYGAVEDDKFVMPDSAATNPLDTFWTNYPPTEFTLGFPTMPSAGDPSIALSVYNATGGEYPFTCI